MQYIALNVNVMTTSFQLIACHSKLSSTLIASHWILFAISTHQLLNVMGGRNMKLYVGLHFFLLLLFFYHQSICFIRPNADLSQCTCFFSLLFASILVNCFETGSRCLFFHCHDVPFVAHLLKQDWMNKSLPIFNGMCNAIHTSMNKMLRWPNAPYAYPVKTNNIII